MSASFHEQTFPAVESRQSMNAMQANVLCELVDRFDAHYGEQICRFYAQQHTNSRSPPTDNPDDSTF